MGIMRMMALRTKSIIETLIHDARMLMQCPPCIDLSQIYARGEQSRHMRIIVLTQQATTSAATVYAVTKNRLEGNVVIYRCIMDILAQEFDDIQRGSTAM